MSKKVDYLNVDDLTFDELKWYHFNNLNSQVKKSECINKQSF